MGNLSLTEFRDCQERIELKSETGFPILATSFGMSLYTNTLLSQQKAGVLALYDRFFDLCPKERISFYSNENSRKHKKASKSTFNLLPTWLKPDAAEREFLSLELKSGKTFQDAAVDRFTVFGTEPKYQGYKIGDANLVDLSFEPEGVLNSLSTYRDLFIEACELLQFRSGLAGFQMNCTPYGGFSDNRSAETQAAKLGLLYKAFDIPRPVRDVKAVGRDGVKGISWLTSLADEIIQEVGGLPKLKKSLPGNVELTRVRNGVVLQIGEGPILGNVDSDDEDLIASYKKVFELVSPHIQRAAKRSPSLNLREDYVEKTEQWFTRWEG